MKKNILFMIVGLLTAEYAAEVDKLNAVFTVPHELDILLKAGHIQGACCTEQGIYLAHQLGIEKIDWNGKLVKHIDAPAHLGDIGYANGRIYGAFVLRNLPKEDKNPGLIRVWNEDLETITEKRFPWNLDGATVMGDTLYCGIDRWGRPEHPGASILSLDLDLNVKATNDVDFGFWIAYGVQTMATDGTDLYCCNYVGKEHNPQHHNTARLNRKLEVLSTTRLGGSEGFGLVPKSISKRDVPVFFAIRALGGNMKGWRKDPVNNPPRLRIDFYELRNGTFTNITQHS